jgi:hypothetical protein
MRLKVRIPDLAPVLDQTEEALAAGLTRAAGRLTAGLKADLRADVVAGGLGARLSRTWQGKTFPQSRDSLEPSSFLWSKAPMLIDVFDRGAIIRSKDGWFLAIPTALAGPRGIGRDGKAARITPGGWERRAGLRLRFVYRRGRPSLLVADGTRVDGKGRAASAKRAGTPKATSVIFILVPQAKLRKRLDIDGTVADWADRAPGLVADELTRIG